MDLKLALGASVVLVALTFAFVATLPVHYKPQEPIAPVAVLDQGPAYSPTPLRLDMVVKVDGEEEKGHCSGTAVAPDVVLTASHCLGGLTALYLDGTLVQVVKVIEDGKDHSLIKVSALFDKYSRLNFSEVHEYGQKVAILGNPGPMTRIYRSGEYSGVMDDGSQLYNLPIFPGDSGSAIFDEHGDIVGVVSMYKTMEYGHARLQLAQSFRWDFKSSDVCEMTKQECR